MRTASLPVSGARARHLFRPALHSRYEKLGYQPLQSVPFLHAEHLEQSGTR